MNKSLEALLRGYIIFKVNNKYFLSYNKANKYCNTLCEGVASGHITFYGFSLLKQWRCFYLEVKNPQPDVDIKSIEEAVKWAEGVGKNMEANSET